MNVAVIHNRPGRGAALALLWGFVILLGAGPALSAVFTDGFSGPELNPLWEIYTPRKGATVSLPGSAVRIQTPASGSFDSWTSVNSAPQVRMDAPDGDFTFEARLSLPGAPQGRNYQAGLCVVFGPNDLFYWGPYTGTRQVKLERSGDQSHTPHTIPGAPVGLQIVKVGTEYRFYYRTGASTLWFRGATATATEKPLKIGFIVKTWGPVAVTADFSGFSLDAGQLPVDFSQGWIRAHVLNGTSLVSGPWLLVKDSSGHQVGGYARPAQGGSAAVFNLPPGTYSVKAVHPYIDTSPEQTVTVTAGQESDVDLQVVPCPNLSLKSSSADVLAMSDGGWKLLPGPAGSRGSAKIKADIQPSTEAYTPSGTDATFGTPWIDSVRVPGNYGPNTIKDDSLFWYRLDLNLPDSYARFAGRVWTLYGYNVDDEDVTYFNGYRIGSIRSKTTDNSWSTLRTYTILPAYIHPTGHNVIAVQGFEGGGGAGITSAAPSLRIPSDSDNDVTVYAEDSAGNEVDGIHVTATSLGGAYTVEADTADGKGVTFTDLPEGEYRVAFDRSIGLDPTPARPLVVQPGTGMEAHFTVPALPFQDLRSDSLDAAGLPGWSFMAIPSAMSGQAASDPGPAQTDYVDVFEDAAYGTDWFSDAPVPADLGWGDPSHPDTTFPIENNSYYWYRLHLTIPDSWRQSAPDRDLILTGFQVDDSDWTYFNGQPVGHTQLDWQKVRTYLVPRDLVRWGADNVIAIKGYQVTGGAGIVEDPDVLFALAAQPKDTASAGFIKGDVDGSGAIDLLDVARALQIALGVGQPASASSLAAGDLNDDGQISIDEVVRILEAAIGIQSL